MPTQDEIRVWQDKTLSSPCRPMSHPERLAWVKNNQDWYLCCGEQDVLITPDAYQFARPCQHGTIEMNFAERETKKFTTLFGDHPPCTFENWDATRPGAAEPLGKARYIATTWNHGAVFTGPTGTGKSHLAKALCFAAVACGKKAFWASSPWLAKLFRDSEGHDYEADEAKQMVERASRAGLLVIDDLGTERKTESGVWEEQFPLFLDRFKGILVITTNLSSEDLGKAVGRKVLSRIAHKCGKVEFHSRDMRFEQRPVLEVAP